MKVRRQIQTEDITITPTKVFSIIQEAHDNGIRIVSLQGSARSGKTYNTMIWLIVYAYNNPGTHVVVVRSTMPRLKLTVYKDFLDIMGRLGPVWQPNHMKENTMTYSFDNGSEIVFFASEDSMRAQGLPSDILFINEAAELEYDVWSQLTLRCTDMVIIDYNPQFSDDHWISKLNRNPPKGTPLLFSKTTYKDNPYLPKEQVAQIESLRETDEHLWRIYGLGEQSIVEGLIFPNVTIVEEMPPRVFRHAYVGIDWGYNDPFAVTLVGIDHFRKELYLQEVCYKSFMSQEEQVNVLTREPCKGRIMVCDPTAAQFIKAARKRGCRINAGVRQTSFSTRSIVPGISAMKSYKIFITKDSLNGIVEQQNYTWEKDRNGEYTNEPIGKFNHFWDSARYVVYEKGGGMFGKNKGISIRN